MASIPQVDGLIAQVMAIKDVDVRHAELGSVGGFQAVQDVKDAIARYLLGLLSAIREVIGYVDDATLDEVLEEIRQLGRSTASTLDEFNKLAAEDLHNPQFPTRRDAQIANLQERGVNFRRTFRPHEAVIRVAYLDRLVNASRAVELTAEAEAKLASIEGLLSQATKALENVQTKAMGRAVESAVAGFDRLRSGHASREVWWFKSFLGSAGITMTIVAWVAFSSWTINDFPHAVTVIFRKLLLISAPVLFMRVSLAKYNLERNLRILYDHRDTVLTQYRTFETAIGDDASAKNQFRLEIAKYIFSDPVTGYVTQDAGAEINVNPIVSMIERVVTK